MTSEERAFVNVVRAYYRREGRHDLPWRKTRNPYRILVSEVMLQQTQVARVVPKYKSFLKRFPTARSLAEASLGEVLRAWQGLGYNRRAKMLWSAVRTVVETNRGTFPTMYDALRKLPGIGPYTAGAIMAFAYNTPLPIIETNIRTVFIHHFFSDAVDVPDSAILHEVERTLDRKEPREWYYALMDYGSYLKETVGNLNTRSKHYTVQTQFKNSDRQIRGAILRALSTSPHTRAKLSRVLPYDVSRIDAQIERLTEEGLLTRRGATLMLPT